METESAGLVLWNYPFFSREEMECKGFKKGLCRCGGVLPTDEFMQALVAVRKEVNFPLIVNSGARCALYNDIVGGEENSAHVLRIAVDLSVYGSRFALVFVAAVKHGMLGIGVSQKQGTDYAQRFIHLDKMQRDWIRPGEIWSWSY